MFRLLFPYFGVHFRFKFGLLWSPFPFNMVIFQPNMYIDSLLATTSPSSAMLCGGWEGVENTVVSSPRFPASLDVVQHHPDPATMGTGTPAEP